MFFFFLFAKCTDAISIWELNQDIAYYRHFSGTQEARILFLFFPLIHLLFSGESLIADVSQLSHRWNENNNPWTPQKTLCTSFRKALKHVLKLTFTQLNLTQLNHNMFNFQKLFKCHWIDISTWVSIIWSTSLDTTVHFFFINRERDWHWHP